MRPIQAPATALPSHGRRRLDVIINPYLSHWRRRRRHRMPRPMLRASTYLSLVTCFLPYTPPASAFLHRPRPGPLTRHSSFHINYQWHRDRALHESLSSGRSARSKDVRYDSDAHHLTNTTTIRFDPSSLQQQEIKWKRVLKPKGLDHVEHYHERMNLVDKVSLAGTGVAALAFLAWLVAYSGPGAWRYYLAGGICAAVSHAVPVPIDVVKTRKQVDPNLYKLPFWNATQEIVAQEGWSALLAGLGPTVTGYMLEGAIKFGVYEILKSPTRTVLASIGSSLPGLAWIQAKIIVFMVSASVAGVAASAMLCPMEALRIRIVAERDFAPQGWLQGFDKMVQYEGVGALWKGMLPMVLKQVPYTVTKNVSFDYMTKMAYAAALAQQLHLGPGKKFAIPLFSAAIASVFSCVTSQPGDLLLSLVNAHEGNRTTRDIIKDILRSTRGVKGFFMGLQARLLHVGIIVTLQLLIYDFVKRVCGIAATGSV